MRTLAISSSSVRSCVSDHCASPAGASSRRTTPAEPGAIRLTTTSAEFDLLLAFCQHSGEVLSREQLLEFELMAGSPAPVKA